jgi:bifunctional non-homologous end joining protein LigD
MPATRSARKPTVPPIPSAVAGTLPSSQAPQLASNAEAIPKNGEWVSELKWDGYRLLVWTDRGKVRLATRNGHDWTNRMPRLAARFLELGVEQALIDGELVALRPNGTDSFHDLQRALSEGRDDALFFYAFDLLHLNGWDLRPCRLVDRKGLLQQLGGWNAHLRYAQHISSGHDALLAAARRMRLEGIICKRADASYRGGRSVAWLKIKCVLREEFVVLGWLPPGGSRIGIGALALGFYDADHRMHYAGSVGTGFSDQELVDLHVKLSGMTTPPPALLIYAGDRPDQHIRWVEPALVAEVSFTAWSGEGRVRHPVYVGMSEDKIADQVVKDIPDPERERKEYRPLPAITAPAKVSKYRWKGAVPPVQPDPLRIVRTKIRR